MLARPFVLSVMAAVLAPAIAIAIFVLTNAG